MGEGPAADYGGALPPLPVECGADKHPVVVLRRVYTREESDADPNFFDDLEVRVRCGVVGVSSLCPIVRACVRVRYVRACCVAWVSTGPAGALGCCSIQYTDVQPLEGVGGLPYACVHSQETSESRGGVRQGFHCLVRMMLAVSACPMRATALLLCHPPPPPSIHFLAIDEKSSLSSSVPQRVYWILPVVPRVGSTHFPQHTYRLDFATVYPGGHVDGVRQVRDGDQRGHPGDTGLLRERGRDVRQQHWCQQVRGGDARQVTKEID